MTALRSERPVVIVTGASGGIGAATARLFAERGWAVVLAARSEEKIQRIAQEIELGGTPALAVQTDVTSWPEDEGVRILGSPELHERGEIMASSDQRKPI